MGIFQFKRFSVQNEKSSMKVNTDGVLLGAAMTLRPSDRLLLDIGTGTGVIALMTAQRLAEIRAGLKFKIKGGMEFEDAATPDFKIIGIDIDEASAAEAAENFAMSPWADKLVARHISLSDFEKECTKKWYNHIFSNPPYFESSLKSPDERKRAARHAETMSYREIIAFAARHLASADHLANKTGCNEGQHSAALPGETEREGGRLSMVLPYETEREAVRYAASFGLRLFRRLRIRTTPSHPLSRVILEFNLATSDPETISNECTNKETPALRNENKPVITDDELTIQTSAGYTDSYRSLVRDFLLI